MFEVFNDLYSAVYYSIYKIWKTQHKDISDSGFVIQEVETSAKKNPVQMIRTVQKLLNERKKTKVPSNVGHEGTQGGAGVDRVEKFVGLCDLDDKKEDSHFV